MNMPYTPYPKDAMGVAQSSICMVLTAFLWRYPIRPRLASILIALAVWLCATIPFAKEWMESLFTKHLTHDFELDLMKVSALVMTLAILSTRRWTLIVTAFIGQFVLWQLTHYLMDSNYELSILHITWAGVLIGLYHRFEYSPSHLSDIAEIRTGRKADYALLFVGFITTLAVCLFILNRTSDSADEWAYIYQAKVFGQGRAYGPVPACADTFMNHWVFFYKGRSFSQYTPGWALALTPLAKVGVEWLTTPIVHGLMGVGTARLARRIAHEAGFASTTVERSGILSGLAAMLGPATMLNGGSCFSHTFVATTWVWSIEALCTLESGQLSKRQRWFWGMLFGSCISLLVATRPGDGVTLGSPIFFYFVYALIRRRLGWYTVLTIASTFVPITILVLVILRLQLGVWFQTGYSITEQIHAWAGVSYVFPTRREIKFGIPLATSSYCFWPCAYAIAAIGLLCTRKRASRITFMLCAGSVLFLGFISMVTFGRYSDFGYGPRYHLFLVVPLGIGTGIAIARIWENTSKSFRFIGKLNAEVMLAFSAWGIGIVRIIILMYPLVHQLIRDRNVVLRAIENEQPHNAVVLGGIYDTYSTKNDFLKSYSDVLIARDYQLDCLQSIYPNRKFYRATNYQNGENILVPIEKTK